MRIQALIPIKTPILKSTPKNKLPLLKNDSFTFRGRLATTKEENDLAFEAMHLKYRAQTCKDDLSGVLSESFDDLFDSKDTFVIGYKYANLARRNKTFSDIELENGHKLSFQIDFRNNNAYMEILETDEEGCEVMSVTCENFVPVRIIKYHENEVDIYDFSKNTITLTKNLDLAGQNPGSVEKITKFCDGKISSVWLNGQILDESKTFETMYQFVDDKIFAYCTDIEKHNDSNFSCDERFIFDKNGKLLNYFEGFLANTATGAMSFEQSYHYNNGKFIAQTNDSYCDKKDDELKTTDGFYYDKAGKLIHSKNLHFLMSDFETAIFEDME